MALHITQKACQCMNNLYWTLYGIGT